MAQARDDLETAAMYRAYLRARERYGAAEPERPSPGHVIRYCHACGQRAMFRLDPEGMWYECMHCQHFD